MCAEAINATVRSLGALRQPRDDTRFSVHALKGRDAALRRPRTAINLAYRCADGAARHPYHTSEVRQFQRALLEVSSTFDIGHSTFRHASFASPLGPHRATSAAPHLRRRLSLLPSLDRALE